MRELQKLMIESVVKEMNWGSDLREHRDILNIIISDYEIMSEREFKKLYKENIYNYDELRYYRKLINKKLEAIRGTYYY